jgi:hypothetical protein
MKVIDLRALEGGETGFVVKGEGKFPRLAQFPDGTLYIATHRGTHQPDPENSLQGLVSLDGGRTWSGPRPMFRKHGIDPRSPALGVGPDGILYAGWRERDWQDAFDSRVAFYRSEDRGGRWEFVSEVRVPDSERVGHPYGKLLFDGDRTLMCVYTVAEDSAEPMDSRLFETRDGGRSWRQLSVISENANETAMHRRRDGSLVAIYRDDGPAGLWSRLSGDGGRTWGPARTVSRPGEHPAETVSLSGRVLCFYGRRHRPFGVRARVSEDEGLSWRDDVVLVADDTCASPDCGYPTVARTGDGHVFVAWYVNSDQPEDLNAERQCRYLRCREQAINEALGG